MGIPLLVRQLFYIGTPTILILVFHASLFTLHTVCFFLRKRICLSSFVHFCTSQLFKNFFFNTERLFILVLEIKRKNRGFMYTFVLNICECMSWKTPICYGLEMIVHWIYKSYERYLFLILYVLQKDRKLYTIYTNEPVLSIATLLTQNHIEKETWRSSIYYGPVQ